MANDRKLGTHPREHTPTHYGPFANSPDSPHATYSSIQQRTQNTPFPLHPDKSPLLIDSQQSLEPFFFVLVKHRLVPLTSNPTCLQALLTSARRYQTRRIAFVLRLIWWVKPKCFAYGSLLLMCFVPDFADAQLILDSVSLRSTSYLLQLIVCVILLPPKQYRLAAHRFFETVYHLIHHDRFGGHRSYISKYAITNRECSVGI